MLRNSKKILMLIASMLMIITMVSFTGCSEEKTDNPKATIAPRSEYTLEVTGPDTLTEGETVEYIVKVTDCAFEEGLIGIDFCVDYNNELLEYESSETLNVPAATWEVIAREDSDEKLTFFCIEDNDIIEDCIAVTGADQFEVKMTFTVLKDTSEDKNIVKLYDVMGTKNDAEVSVAYGSGNSIELK